jgi:hypothetical protein
MYRQPEQFLQQQLLRQQQVPTSSQYQHGGQERERKKLQDMDNMEEKKVE